MVREMRAQGIGATEIAKALGISGQRRRGVICHTAHNQPQENPG